MMVYVINYNDKQEGVKKMKRSMKGFLVFSLCICLIMGGTVCAQEDTDGQEIVETEGQGETVKEQGTENVAEQENRSETGTAQTDEEIQEENQPVALSGGVDINEATFPDANFRKYVSEQFDTDGDGRLSEDEINQVTRIDVAVKNISDLTGIGYFTSLTSLDCYSNQLISLDVSQNTGLTHLYCYSNQLTSLDVSQNTRLTDFSCANNRLTSLDVSGNTGLTALYCAGNQLTSLDVSGNTGLTALYCGDNQLTSLDVSGNTGLTQLYCDDNQLTSLDVRNCDQLLYLDVRPLEKESVQYLHEPSAMFLYGSSGMVGSAISTNLNSSEIQANTNQVNTDAVFRAFNIDTENTDAEIIVEQKEADVKNREYLDSYAKKSGDKVLKVYDVVMNLYADNEYKGTVTDNFGNLTLTFYTGKEYEGKKAAVYQLHGGNEVITYKDLTIDNDGMVTVTVSKLSTFAVALQSSADAVNAENTIVKKAPETGDSANVLLWFTLSVLAMAVLVCSVLKRQSRKA